MKQADKCVRSILLETTRGLGGLRMHGPHRKGDLWEFALRWPGGGKGFALSAVWAGEGWPGDVRRALASFRRRWPREAVVVAREFSPGALEQLHERGANWVDATGNMRLLVPPGLAIIKEGKEGRRKGRPPFSWSPSASDVGELILGRSDQKLQLGEVAAATAWSVPQVSNVLRHFDSFGWTKKHGPRRGPGVWREVVEPGGLLDMWAAHLAGRPRARRLGHRLMRDPMRFLRDDLAPALGKQQDWAITGWAGLEIVAPYMTAVPALQIYVSETRLHEALPRISESAGIREVEEGANVEFWTAPSPLLTTAGLPERIPVVNTPRLYADLLMIGGRAREGARYLRETRLGY